MASNVSRGAAANGLKVRSKQALAPCVQCGIWHKRPNRHTEPHRSQQRHFCSRECMDRARGYNQDHECLYCGAKFHSFNRKGGVIPKFCSWRCSNRAHGRSTTDLRLRVVHEYELMELLTLDGWSCRRSRGGRGPFDVVAVNSEKVRLIQVKSTTRATAKSNIGDYVKAIRLLRGCPTGGPVVEKWLYLLQISQGWKSVREDLLPGDDNRLRSALLDWAAA